MTRRPEHHRHLSGFWGWFSRLPALSKWGLVNVAAQLGLAILAVVAPQAVVATLGGAALGFASQALNVDHVLIGMLKSAAPGLTGVLA